MQRHGCVQGSLHVGLRICHKITTLITNEAIISVYVCVCVCRRGMKGWRWRRGPGRDSVSLNITFTLGRWEGCTLRSLLWVKTSGLDIRTPNSQWNVQWSYGWMRSKITITVRTSAQKCAVTTHRYTQIWLKLNQTLKCSSISEWALSVSLVFCT